MILHPPTADFIEEMANIEMSKRLRFATALKNAGEYELAEVVFPDTPAFEPQHELEAAA